MTPHPDTETVRRLGAIANAIGEIERFTVGRTQADYLRGSVLRSAVLWQLVRICEPVRLLARDDLDVAQRINGYRDIIGFRTRLIHRYHQIRFELVWRYVQDDLPGLRADVRTLLEATDD